MVISRRTDWRPRHITRHGYLLTHLGRASSGLLVAAAISLVLALGFNLTAIASIGTAVALLIFMLVTIAHLRVWAETGVRTSILVPAVTTADIAFSELRVHHPHR